MYVIVVVVVGFHIPCTRLRMVFSNRPFWRCWLHMGDRSMGGTLINMKCLAPSVSRYLYNMVGWYDINPPRPPCCCCLHRIHSYFLSLTSKTRYCAMRRSSNVDVSFHSADWFISLIPIQKVYKVVDGSCVYEVLTKCLG